MNLWHLKTFCAVYEKRSFTKATGVVHRTQPSISAQIAELEKYYGTQLFIRKGREVTATESGETLYRYAQRILRLSEKTKETIDNLGGLTRGHVVVGGSTIPGTYILPKLLSDFKKEYPEIHISISISDTKNIIERVLDGQLEIGVVGEKISDKRLDFKPLAEDRIVFIVSSNSHLAKKRFVTFDVLQNEPIIVRENGSGTRGTVQKALEKKGFGWRDQNVTLEFGSTEAVKNGVVAGLGNAFVSTWSIEREKRLHIISELPVKGLEIRRHFYLVLHKGWPLSRASQVFSDFCASKAVLSIPGEK
jgi:DNA-binding transcriptional LysR family regulator